MFMKMNPRTSVSNHNHHQQSQYHRHHNVDDDIDANRIVKCTLNEDQCLSLEDILRSFQTSINEEQAWALCYQMVKCFRQYYQSTKNASQYCYLITDPSHVLIHKDGHVHPKTLHLKTIQGASRTLAKSSHKLLTSLGIVLFRALDYGLCEDEERTLSKPLELLIERLTKANELATNNSRHQKNSNRHQQTSSSSTTTTTTTATTIIIPATTTTTTSSSSSSTTTTTLNHHRANAARPASNGVQKPKTTTVGATAAKTLVQSSSANNNHNNNSQVKISNNDQMNSIGSMYYEEDENDHSADGLMIDDDDDDDDGGDHRLEDEDEDEDDEEEDVVAEDDEDDDDEDDDDECANADEGIDCHEYGDDNHHLDHHHDSSASFDSDHQMANALFKFDQVMQMCVSRLSSRESADNHYKAVCRALLAETLELSTFLDQIVKGTKELKKSSVLRIESTTTTSNNDHNDSTATLDDLQFHDWARLWIQVIRELRHGVKLKKVDQEDLIHNTEYELTPYEMLLDDIRSRRYKLNKVMVNGDLPPRVKKDAHELILDFIRSRPPLVPVAQRVLKPAPEKKVTLYERLMESIRQEHKLRPTPKPEMKMYSLSAHVTPIHHPATIDEDDSGDGGSVITMDRGRKNSTTSIGSAAYNNNNSARRPSSSSRRKKVIKADIQLDLFSDDDDEDQQRILSVVQLPTRTRPARSASTANTRPRSAYFPSEMDFNYLNDDHDHDHDHVVDDNTSNNNNLNHNHDGSGGDADSKKNGAISDGNHSVSSAGNRTILRLKKLSSQFFSKERRHSISVCDLKALEQHQKQQEQLDRDLIEDLDFNEDARNHVASIWSQNDFGRSLECLSLTLKEVQHIRSVLTKAEIESLGVTKTLKKDLENGKICFTCLKTRFTFWGPWATICKLCNRAICDRCATKMHIPVEQFDRVPIYMLSPTPSPPNERHVLDIFKFASAAPDGGRQNQSTSTSTKPRAPTSDAQENAAAKSLPPSKPSETSGNRMMRLVRLLTINNNNSNADATTAMTSDHDDDQDGDQHDHDGGSRGSSNPKPETKSQSNKTSGPLVKVCRDCKILVRHLIDIGHTNFGAGKFQNGFPAQ